MECAKQKLLQPHCLLQRPMQKDDRKELDYKVTCEIFVGCLSPRFFFVREGGGGGTEGGG